MGFSVSDKSGGTTDSTENGIHGVERVWRGIKKLVAHVLDSRVITVLSF